MNPYFKLSVLAVTASLLTLTVKKNAPELSLVLTLAACTAAALLLLSWMEPILELVQSLCDRAGLEARLTAPLLKTAGIGLLTQISAAVCADAGQSALSKLVELGGGIVCLCLCLPLLEAVLALLGELL